MARIAPLGSIASLLVAGTALAQDAGERGGESVSPWGWEWETAPWQARVHVRDLPERDPHPYVMAHDDSYSISLPRKDEDFVGPRAIHASDPGVRNRAMIDDHLIRLLRERVDPSRAWPDVTVFGGPGNPNGLAWQRGNVVILGGPGNPVLLTYTRPDVGRFIDLPTYEDLFGQPIAP